MARGLHIIQEFLLVALAVGIVTFNAFLGQPRNAIICRWKKKLWWTFFKSNSIMFCLLCIKSYFNQPFSAIWTCNKQINK